MKQRIRSWHILVAMAIAVLSVGDAAYLWREGENVSEVLHGAAEVALLLLLLELIIISIVEQDEFLNYARGAIERTASALARYEAFSINETTHPLLRIMGRESIRRFLSMKRFTERSWAVEGHEEALESYVVFWNFLVERQLESKYEIPVQVVHSLDIGIWNEDKMKVVLDKQREFIEAGGSIRRVLITTKSPDQVQLAVANEMMSRGVQVYFVQRSEFEHDFLIARSLDIVVRWSGTVRALRVQSVEYTVEITPEEKGSFAEKWDTGMAGAVDAKSLS